MRSQKWNHHTNYSLCQKFLHVVFFMYPCMIPYPERKKNSATQYHPTFKNEYFPSIFNAFEQCPNIINIAAIPFRATVFSLIRIPQHTLGLFCIATRLPPHTHHTAMSNLTMLLQKIQHSFYLFLFYFLN